MTNDQDSTSRDFNGNERFTKEDVSNVESFSITRLIKGFPTYFKTLKKISQNLLSYPNTLNFRDPLQFRESLRFATYGIFICFFITIPIFIIHNAEVSSTTFLIRYLVQFAMYGFFMHIGLKILGARDSNLKKTLTVYSFVGGIGAPLGIIIIYPILLKVGIIGLFGKGTEIEKIGMELSSSPGLLIYSNIINILFAIFSITVALNWFSKSHNVGKWRVFFALFIAGLIGGVIQLFLLHPFFNILSIWIDKISKFV